MRETTGQQPTKPITDQYGNLHHKTDELARGGQGVVFRTKDTDLAIKQPLDEYEQLDHDVNLQDRFREIRRLPLPADIKVSLPLAILDDEPGYVMRLLSGMKPFASFDLDGKTKLELKTEKLPKWLEAVSDHDTALRLLHYSRTGSTRRRLYALSKCASVLARLHSAGLVYGDISPNNAFVGDGYRSDVWLIDADNLRFELQGHGATVYTPGYAAPEIMRGTDSSRPRTDCWAFAVMAFNTLALCHPFIGKKVLQPEDDDGGWDAEPSPECVPADLDDRAYAGYFPFVDDEDDDSNRGGGLPRDMVMTEGLRRLFQETFGAGREEPHRRPTMGFWALELAKAFDRSLECPECKMSYFADGNKSCPYCDNPRPALVRAITPGWEILIPNGVDNFPLPHRMFYPFSVEKHDDTEHKVVLDYVALKASPVRGEEPFPENLRFLFEGART